MSKIRGPINNNYRAFVGAAERRNPAMTAKRLRQGVKETLNINVVGKKERGPTNSQTIVV